MSIATPKPTASPDLDSSPGPRNGRWRDERAYGPEVRNVAALAERGRRRASHFPSFNQAGPTRSATVGDGVYSGARQAAATPASLAAFTSFRRPVRTS